MQWIVNSSEMKQLDKNTITHFGMPSLVLMERAALAVVENLPPRLSHGGRHLIVCGNGNNGADGLAVARLLRQRGCGVTVVRSKDSGRRTEENKLQGEILERYGVPIAEDIPQDASFDCVIEALFGIGLSREPQGEAAKWLCAMNRLGGYKVAVDMPAGVSADTGAVYAAAFRADLTVTFAYLKVGQAVYPGAEYCGKTIAAQIGITKESWLGEENWPSCYSLQKSDLNKIPVRAARSNKGTFGKALVVAGGRDMAGAALFCAKAAYRTGCGLVKIYTPEENRAVLQSALPEAVIVTSDSKRQKPEKLFEAVQWADVIAIGPGLGTGKRAQMAVETVLQNASVPVIADADALNILSRNPEWLQHHRQELVITPHFGEMARLGGKSISSIKNTVTETAREFAKQYRVICVLKDAATVTALPDGTMFLNRSGCSALAKGGSGDVLTGVITGLAAQGMPVKAAAPLGVYLHGLAGEYAAEKTGAYGLLAGELADAVSRVIKESGE